MFDSRSIDRLNRIRFGILLGTFSVRRYLLDLVCRCVCAQVFPAYFPTRPAQVHDDKVAG